jgi:hypothetical protein
MTNLQEEPNSLIKSYKFIRRLDINPEQRLRLASLLTYFNYHGQVKKFAKKYNVSRTFLYDLKAIFSAQTFGIFSPDKVFKSSRSDYRNCAYKEILDLRLIGKCSLSAISLLLAKKDKELPHSTCFISQFLKRLGGRLGKMVNWQGSVFYACDEIFMIGHQPVLVTVDPVSSTILRMEVLKNLTKECWEAHWKSLRSTGIIPTGIVKDEGVAMKAALSDGVMSGVDEQTDTFHAVSKHWQP